MSDFKPPPGSALQIVMLVFLLFCSMFFSASETAFLSINKLRIRYLKQRKNKKASQVHKILQNKTAFLTTELVANTLVNNLITVMITAVAVSFFNGENAVGIATTVATILILVFGEIVPKAVALIYSDAIAMNSSSFVTGLIKFFSPVVWFFNLLTTPLLFLLGIRNDNKNLDLTEDDLKIFFEESEKLGQISKYERSMMEKILGYADIQAKNIMTPRPEIKAVQLGTHIEEILQLSKNSRFSRFPVYNEDIDDIKGIFFLKDFLISPFFLNKSNYENFHLANYLREPVFVFETTRSDRLQELFHESTQNMLIVLDEYGGTAGIVTIEDLAEVVFGDIEDEYDIKTKNKNLTKIKDGFMISGSMQISDFNEEFRTNFSDTQHETIAGIVMEKCGEIPAQNIAVIIDGYRFEVVDASKKKIKLLKVTEANE